MSEDTLDAAELVELRERNVTRLAALNEQGATFTETNTFLAFSYLRSMLEVLLADRLPEAQLLHERNVSAMLDIAEGQVADLESQMRRQQLAAPGVPNLPNGLLR